MEICSVCGNDKELKKVVEEFNVPFKCGECGGIKFKYQAIRDIVFVWPDAPEKVTKGGLHIPSVARKDVARATVLSAGKGYWTKKGAFMESGLKVGDRVLYNKDVPWRVNTEDAEDKMRTVPVMGAGDVFCLLT